VRAALIAAAGCVAPAQREEHAMSTFTMCAEERPQLPFIPDPNLTGEPALEVQAIFNGSIVGTRFLSGATAGKRIRQGIDPQSSYVIGQSPGVDAPAAIEILGATDFPLVSKWGEGFLVHVTPHMSGEVAVDGKVVRLADYLKGRGENFTLPAKARARINCGAMTFRLDHTTQAEPLPKRWFAWRWEIQKFTLGSCLALGLFLAMMFMVPPEESSVSSDFAGMNRSLIPFIIKAPEPEKVSEILPQRPDTSPGQSGQAHVGASGSAGDRNSKKSNGALSIKGDGKHLGKAEAEAAILNKGILGILRSTQDARFVDIFGHGSAAGDAQESILGNLASNEFADGYGVGGWGILGTGAGGGGYNLRTIGMGKFNTMGGKDYGRGPGIGNLAQRHPRPPSVTQGIITTKGSLDKEIIRRVVHLHMNEVKFCYDKELSRKADLAGRISVQFVISGMGEVISSVVQSSTMDNPHVESCVVGAVKRWPFPKPTGGGIAIVSYPFNFVAGSGG
jgi:hypothetical protein